MDCTQFLSGFTDYRDGRLDPTARSRMERHLDACPPCRRYSRVVDVGVRALRSAPLPEVPEDFRPRLQHRIYHLEDGDSLGPDRSGSGVTAFVAAGMALLLALAAWSPTLGGPEARVVLPVLVVSDPPRPESDPLLAAPSLFVDAPSVRGSAGWNPGPSWEHPTALLLEYSPLMGRTPAVRAASSGGLD